MRDKDQILIIAQENLVKVKDNLIVPTASVAMALSGKTIPKYIGSAYLGNKMADAETPYPEGAVAVTGMLGSKTDANVIFPILFTIPINFVLSIAINP
jgi:hypothetical protein